MSNEELVAVIQSGATERMGELWEQVSGLVKRKANHIMSALDLRGNPCGVEFEDLYQSGYLAVVAAVNTYDPAADASFSTWLMYHLKTVFAEATGYRTQKGRQEPLNTAFSLDKPLTDESDSSLFGDFVPDNRATATMEAIEEKEYRRQLRESVEDALSTVPEQYREILRLRYWEDMTLEDVGDLYGISRERVRQMENKGIRILRRPKMASQLYAFYDFDFYGGTGLSAFRYGSMSVQERYLVNKEERKEREFRYRLEKQEKDVRCKVRDMLESIKRETDAKVATMTPEEKRALLEKYGYA